VETRTDQENHTTNYHYDSLGRLTHVHYPDPAEDETYTYAPDANGRPLSAVTVKSGSSRTLADGAAYKPFGPLSGFDLGNGIEVRKTFDQDYRLTALTADGVMDLSYIHYLNGMIREITDNLDPARSQYFTYDNLGRLKTANGVYGRMAWTYDNVGNRLTETRNGITESYTYKTGTNIIESVDGALDKTFTHDDDGNIHTALIQKTSASPSVTADYMYTSDGLRLRKTAGGTVVLYHYDFAGNLIGESGIGGENFKAYVYFAGTRVATVAADGSVCYYHNNHLETPVSMTDGSGNVVWKADYKPFGKAEVSSASTVVNDFRFPGQYYDSETGLHYNWNRYYDPGTGRYLTPDPIGLDGGMNLYLYAGADPVNFVDPWGLIWVTIGTDYHGVKNWLKVLVKHLSTIDEGIPLGSNPQHYEFATRDLIQEWQKDPNNPCKDKDHKIGEQRKIRQSYIKQPKSTNNELWDDTATHYWSPQIPSPTYNEYK